MEKIDRRYKITKEMLPEFIEDYVKYLRIKDRMLYSQNKIAAKYGITRERVNQLARANQKEITAKINAS